jgi:hypothetical protein
VLLDEQAVENALYSDERVRRQIEKHYGLKADIASAVEFVQEVVGGFNQHPSDIFRQRSNSEVFTAAVGALASNSRNWSTYLQHRDDLTKILGNLDPQAAKTADLRTVAARLPGLTSTQDAEAILAWANILADYESRGASYYDDVIALARHMGKRAVSQGIELPDEQLMLCMVANLIHEPLRRWDGPTLFKLPGMGFPLGSEFFRNLGWNGFKPDRHIIRLLDGWVPSVVEQQVPTAQALARVSGHNAAGVRTMMCYSLAGIAISPTANYSRTDNYIWLLGAYVEKKARTDKHGFGTYLK